MAEGAPGELTPSLKLGSIEICAPGIGGFVGTQLDPPGSIFARRVSGTAELRVSGGTDPVASAYVDKVLRDVLTEDKGRLRRDGICKLRPAPEPQTARSVRFEIVYEYRHLPSVGQGVIQEIDLGLVPNVTPYAVARSWDAAGPSLIGLDDPFAEFQVLDESGIVSNWSFNAVGGRIEQLSSAALGALDLSEARKTGPELLFRPGGRAFRPPRFIAGVAFESGSPDGIGLVFGRRGSDELWYFLASARHQYHRFARVTGGVHETVGAPALGVGFREDTRHELMLTVYDRTLIAELDGARTLALEAPTDVLAGEIGLLTHGNGQARFHRVRVFELE